MQGESGLWTHLSAPRLPRRHERDLTSPARRRVETRVAIGFGGRLVLRVVRQRRDGGDGDALKRLDAPFLGLHHELQSGRRRLEQVGQVAPRPPAGGSFGIRDVRPRQAGPSFCGFVVPSLVS